MDPLSDFAARYQPPGFPLPLPCVRGPRLHEPGSGSLRVGRTDCGAALPLMHYVRWVPRGGGEGWLITDSRGDTTKQGRHLRTGLGELENVVNEQQHILTLLIAEILGDGEASQSDTSTGTRGLVHLTEDQSDLGVTLQVDDTCLNHLVVQVVSLTDALADTLWAIPLVGPDPYPSHFQPLSKINDEMLRVVENVFCCG